jgi:hypothetical protein
VLAPYLIPLSFPPASSYNSVPASELCSLSRHVPVPVPLQLDPVHPARICLTPAGYASPCRRSRPSRSYVYSLPPLFPIPSSLPSPSRSGPLHATPHRDAGDRKSCGSGGVPKGSRRLHKPQLVYIYLTSMLKMNTV